MAADRESNVHRMRTGEEIRLEASEWIARLNADDVSDEDRGQFESWRSTSASHARAYEEVAHTWQHLLDTGEVVSSVALGQAFAATTEKAVRRSRRASRLRVVMSAAASVVLATLVGLWWVSTLAPRTLFQTAIGEHATVQLPDGSTLELNSNSLARIDYTEQARVIRLDRGEAFFQVEHDTGRPFWVVAGKSWVRAVGTAFNVDVRSTHVRVTVSEGTVKVAASGSAQSPSDAQLARAAVSVLKPGQQVDVHGAETQVRSLAPVDLTRVVSWRGGTVYFKEEKLANVVDELSRYTTLEIVIEDESLRDLGIGGTFETNSQGAQALLSMLEDGFGLQVRRDGSSAYITQARPQ